MSWALYIVGSSGTWCVRRNGSLPCVTWCPG